MTPPWLLLAVLALVWLRAGVLGDTSWGGLYPRESPSREVRSLDGLWNFRLAPLLDPDKGFREHWYSQPLSLVSGLPRDTVLLKLSDNALVRFV
ncbi:Beta-glucuronidase [Portunus trituberculatus]|uniref:Beta-glucuronidase n=1 Tax=Portunus trituberculatus TaxID=210409 RepID=A0A5B7IDD6_PORTR|nr:Beta-glucuronidase [Portunus trituberculatus]